MKKKGSSSMLYKLREDIVYRVVDDEAIMLDIGRGEHYSLNKTATEVVISIDKKRSMDSLLTYLANKYEQEKAIVKRDTAFFINDLLQRNILTR